MMPKLSNGFAIISAIFILVVLAMLGAFAVSFSTSQHISSAQDIISARVYQAARTGMEWGMYQKQINSSCVASTNLAMPATATTLTGFTVTVQCTSGGTPTVYRITSTACNQPNAGSCPNTTNPNSMYVERQLEVFLAP